MTQPNSTPPGTIPVERPHRPTDDTEEVYYEGSPMLRAESGKILIYGLIGVVLIALVVGDLAKWHFGMPWWVPAIVGLIGVGLFFVPAILRRTLRFRITNYRIDVTAGLVSRNTDTIELWHVEDLRLHQSVLDRIVGVGTITIFSHDDTTPKLIMRGLPDPQRIFKMLEQRVIAVKRQQGVMKVDPGQ